MMIGKAIRMERIMDRQTGKTVIVPMDHGVTAGPILGITNMKEAMRQVAAGGANAVVEHKGMVARGHRRSGPDMGLIVHLSASTSLSPHPNAKTLVCTVEEAIKLGADAVSIHVNIGNGYEKEMLADFGKVALSAAEWGMPLLAMIYPRGEKVKDEYDPAVIKHAARLGAELGADMVKVSYTGSPETFREVVEGCHVPVIIAGGPKMGSDRAILEMVRGAIDAGAAGTSIGRNVFQHQNPTRIVRALSMIVHEGADVEKALDFLNHPEKTDSENEPLGLKLARVS
ncbi:2-amino-3,7-dideoxy-D-threo-hept-6-ulosonate synthase [Desulfatiglans anilini]|uniref:2-amino-3,7-dideoxy-D-threo-hept-6-ulosonate synthase n=1 Tax=Desulfatiglans anilini TaxID=90728 RepID=UPI000A007880